MNHELIRFFEGKGTDNRGRTFREIVTWDDDRLEMVHDYIQWLFPLTTASAFNPYAPLLDDDTIAYFRASVAMRAKLRAAFIRILGFYGFSFSDTLDGPEVKRLSEPDTTVRMWVTPGNHNFLRITRILVSLRTLGLETEAKAFLSALEQLYPRHRAAIGDAIHYWRGAMKTA